jgi:hypothetical protein
LRARPWEAPAQGRSLPPLPTRLVRFGPLRISLEGVRPNEFGCELPTRFPRSLETVTLKRLANEGSSSGEQQLNDFKVDRRCLEAGDFDMSPTRQAVFDLGDTLRKLYQPLLREDVTDRLRATIEKLDAKSRGQLGQR